MASSSAAAASPSVAVSATADPAWFTDPRLDIARVELSQTENGLRAYDEQIVDSNFLWRRLANFAEARQLMTQLQGLNDNRRDLAGQIQYMNWDHKMLSNKYELQLQNLQKVAAEILNGYFPADSHAIAMSAPEAPSNEAANVPATALATGVPSMAMPRTPPTGPVSRVDANGDEILDY